MHSSGREKDADLNITYFAIVDFAQEILAHKAQVMQQQGATDFLPQDLYILPDQFYGGSTNIVLIQMNYDSEFQVMRGPHRRRLS
jgi:hypothetical protein